MTALPASVMLKIADIGELPHEAYVGVIDRDAIECLKVRLQAEGLHTPIWVRKNGNAAKGETFSVIAGRHRRIAAIELGWTEIAAEVRAGPDSNTVDLRALQLIENLDRRTLRPIERACFIMERWTAAARTFESSKPKSQQRDAISRRWSVLATVANTLADDRAAIDDATAALASEAPRTIRRYRTLFEKLVAPFPDQFPLINAHPLGESLSAMTTLAAVRLNGPPVACDNRRAAVAMLLSRTDWPNMQAVLIAANLAHDTGRKADKKEGGAELFARWRSLPPIDRKAHVDALAQEVTAGQAKSMVAIFKRRGLL